jgi:hypothetical protein
LNTLRALDFFASLHLTIFEQAANFEFFSQLVNFPMDGHGGAWNQMKPAGSMRM